MTKVNEISVQINARISIPKETAEACLKLVEMYINDNPGTTIQTIANMNSESIRLSFAEQEGDE